MRDARVPWVGGLWWQKVCCVIGNRGGLAFCNKWAECVALLDGLSAACYVAGRCMGGSGTCWHGWLCGVGA
eukprot:scaffold53380_cov21-Tisochrysis_lutea.AAC.5